MPKGVFVRIPGGREKENILCPICGDKFERIINHKYPKCCGKESCKHVIASEVAKKRKGYPSWNIGLQGIDPTKANYDESVAKISKSKIGKNCKEREIRICPVCNAPYKAIKGNKYPMFCSRICADVVRKSKREVRICANEQCTKGIDNKRKKFLALIDKEFPQCCCHECADFKRRSKKIVVTCLNKNCTKGINGKRKQFEDVEGGIRKFCCNDCYHETKKGMKSFFVWEKGKSWNKIPILQDYTQMYQWLVIKSLYYKQVAKIVGCNQISVSYHAEQLGIKKLIPIRHQTEEAKKNAKAGRLRRIRKIGHSFWFTTPFSNSSTLPICTKIDGILSKYYGIDVRSRYAGNIGRGEDKIG